MEHPNKVKKEVNLQVLMLIGIYLAIALLLIAIISLLKNVEEIKANPIAYGIEKGGLSYCACYDNHGGIYDFDAAGQIEKTEYGHTQLFLLQGNKT